MLSNDVVDYNHLQCARLAISQPRALRTAIDLSMFNKSHLNFIQFGQVWTLDGGWRVAGEIAVHVYVWLSPHLPQLDHFFLVLVTVVIRLL